MTTERLYEIIKVQQNQIEDLEKELLYLRKWSDDNDYWLREMIDALTDSIDKNWDKFDNVFERLRDLEEEVFPDDE